MRYRTTLVADTFPTHEPETLSRPLCLVSLLAAVGCSSAGSGAGGGGSGGSAAETGGNTAASAGDSSSAGAASDSTAGSGGSVTAGTGGSPSAGAGGIASAGAGATPSGDTPPIPATVAGQLSVVVRDQGKDIPFDCTGGVGAAAPTYMSNGSITYFSVLCSAGDTAHPRLFRFTVTAMGVPFGVGAHPLTSTTTAPVPNLAVSVVDDGEGFSAANFNGDGGVSFTGVLTLDAVGAQKGDTVSGSFVASWTHVPIVTGNLTTKVAARAGSIAVSFSFARS